MKVATLQKPDQWREGRHQSKLSFCAEAQALQKDSEGGGRNNVLSWVPKVSGWTMLGDEPADLFCFDKGTLEILKSTTCTRYTQKMSSCHIKEVSGRMLFGLMKRIEKSLFC